MWSWSFCTLPTRSHLYRFIIAMACQQRVWFNNPCSMDNIYKELNLRSVSTVILSLNRRRMEGCQEDAGHRFSFGSKDSLSGCVLKQREAQLQATSQVGPNWTKLSKIWGPHGNEDLYCSILVHNTLQYGRLLPVLQANNMTEKMETVYCCETLVPTW